MERVAVGCEGVAARKDDVAHIAVLFVGLFRAEDPFVAAFETVLGRVQIKQRQSQAIDAPRRSLLVTPPLLLLAEVYPYVFIVYSKTLRREEVPCLRI
jgi:hypothetical protein